MQLILPLLLLTYEALFHSVHAAESHASSALQQQSGISRSSSSSFSISSAAATRFSTSLATSKSPSSTAIAAANTTIGATKQNVTSSDLVSARKLIASAVEQQSKYNAYRVANPRRNTYKSRSTARGLKPQMDSADTELSPPTLSSTLLAAAALVAEHSALEQRANGTLFTSYQQIFDNAAPQQHPNATTLEGRASSGYWAAQVDKGLPPMGSDPSYQVYRDVTAFGAKGDGVTDDTKAINAAIAYGNNCGANCLSSSTKGTLVYFPPGTYLISSPINADYYSQLVGDDQLRSIIKTSSSFIGLGAIQSDVYYENGDGGEWYVEQSNFYRQIRNFIIDVSASTTKNVAGLHWQVAQATSLYNVNIQASTNADTTQMGIFTENGSGGFMSDCSIYGGQYGIYGGNQQYTVRNFKITAATGAGIALIWDWGWTWSKLDISGSPYGILLLDPKDNTSKQDPGSIYIMDSTFSNVGTAIQADLMKFTIKDTSIIVLDNVMAADRVNKVISFAGGNAPDVPVGPVDFVVIGNVEDNGMNFGKYTFTRDQRPDSLVDVFSTTFGHDYLVKKRKYFSSSDTILNVKSFGAAGNGVNDDTLAIKKALASATKDNVIYLPPGSYIITSTIVIPAHARITGMVWSQLVASGSYFANIAAPKAMIQVGNPGDVGTIQFTDILFTSIGALPGLIMVEWNIKSEDPGSSGMWDSHFRVGGAYGTKLQVQDCPSTAALRTQCIAANMMLHITKDSTGGYFENMWAWVADHDLDDKTNAQVTIGVARGILIESPGPLWLYGTASEHSMLYQYNFQNTTDTIAGMIQTESAYFQGVAGAGSPGPFNSTIGRFTGDPIFPDSTCNGPAELCNVGWAVIMQNTNNLTIAGAGLYSWFDNYVQTCVDNANCQQRLVQNAGGNQQLEIWNLVTIGAVEMISDTTSNSSVMAQDNIQALAHPFWSALGGYLDSADKMILSCNDEDNSPTCGNFSYNCDRSKVYPDLQSLNTDVLDQDGLPKEGIDDACIQEHTLETLGGMIGGVKGRFDTIDQNYDSLWGWYSDEVKDSVASTLLNFMRDKDDLSKDPGGDGNKYFNCRIDDFATKPCPPNTPANTDHTVVYTPIDKDHEDAFFKDLAENYGIDRSWVKYDKYHYNQAPDFGSKTVCDPTCPNAPQHKGKNVWLEGYPQAKDKSQMVVPNPKDIIVAALPNITSLQSSLVSRQYGSYAGSWSGSLDDLIQVYSYTAIKLDNALDSMQNAKDIGQKAEDNWRKHLVIEILGIVFAVVPFVAEAAPFLAAAAPIIVMVSELANLGVTIASIADDPANGVMSLLMSLLPMGGRGAKTESAMGEAAAARRALDFGGSSKAGKAFKEKDDLVQALLCKCDI